jgi:hypothetical protein
MTLSMLLNRKKENRSSIASTEDLVSEESVKSCSVLEPIPLPDLQCRCLVLDFGHSHSAVSEEWFEHLLRVTSTP